MTRSPRTTALLVVAHAAGISSRGCAHAHAFIFSGTAARRRPQSSHPSTALTAARKQGKKKPSKTSKGSSSGRGFGAKKPSPIALVELDGHGASSSSFAEPGGARPLHSDLLSWLESHPVTYISPKFEIRPSDLGGYGGFATSDIQNDELIFRVPRELCVTYDDVLSDPTCGDVFRQIKDARVPSWGMLLLAGWIAKERLIQQEYASAGLPGVAKHAAYLQSVPWEPGGTLEQDHVLFWSDEEVEVLLGGSLAYNDARLVRRTVDSAIQLLGEFVTPVVCDVRRELRGRINSGAGIYDDDDDERGIAERLERAVRGAFVIALSRSFAEEVENDEGTLEVENVLLPLIDVLQHSNDPNTALEPYDGFVSVRARRNVAAGEELFHRYQEEDDGVIPPHKFFTRYGFVPGAAEPVVDMLKGRSSLFFDS